MNSFLINNLIALEAIQQAQFEKELCLYVDIKDVNNIQGYTSKARISQWETRSPSGVLRVRSYDDNRFEYCVKRFRTLDNGEKETIEKEMDIDKEFFDLMRGLMVSGTIKDRYEFPIEGTNLKWELDVYLDKKDQIVKWAKLDLEVPRDWDSELPPLPIEVNSYFDQATATEDQLEFKDELFELVYNRKNTINIQTSFDQGKLDKKTYTPEQIAVYHGVSLQTILDQLEMGIEVEQEHTSDLEAAKEIALDHLKESATYYTDLKAMEEQEKKD